jgi:hypothetical protein
MYFELEDEHRRTWERWSAWKHDSRYRSFSKFLYDRQHKLTKLCDGCHKETPYVIAYKNDMLCKQCNNGRLRGNTKN